MNLSFFFFFNDTATTEIYTLSLHDALPISVQQDAGCDKICRSPGNDGKSSRQEPGPGKGEGPETMKTGLSTALDPNRRDRKSTRLNSSHSQISYAVFCLKKKKKHNSTVPST